MYGISIQYQPHPEKFETAYLSTRRSGAAGQALTEKKRAYRKSRMELAKATTRMGAIMGLLARIDPNRDVVNMDLEKLCQETDKLIEQANEQKELGHALAQEIILLALEENHGPDAEAIFDTFCDAQIEKLMLTLESGEQPADFFPSHATQPKPSSTTPQDAGRSEPSSSTGSPGGTSKAAP